MCVSVCACVCVCVCVRERVLCACVCVCGSVTKLRRRINHAAANARTPQHSLVSSPLQHAHTHAPHSHETPGAVGRGRKHGATKVVYADSQAHTLKEKAEHEDKQVADE